MKKTDELTVQLFLIYKRRGFTDTQIGNIFGVSVETIRLWKRENGIKNIRINEWATWDRYFPEEIKKMKKRYLELYNKGYKRDAITKEMDLSNGSLFRFVKRYFPEHQKTKVKIRFTPKQKEIVKKSKVKETTVRSRLREGWTFEEAVTIKAGAGATIGKDKRSLNFGAEGTRTTESKVGRSES